MSKDKYALTDLTIIDEEKGISLYRIVALKNFDTILGHVKKGELGGYVCGEHNLSQKGNCWIYANGKASGQAMVLEEAIVCDFAVIQDDAEISGNAILKNYAIAREQAIITGECEIRGHAIIEGNVYLGGIYVVSDYAVISGDVRTSGSGHIINKAYIYGKVILDGKINISKQVIVGGNASITGNIKLTDQVIIKEHASIVGNCTLNGNCKVFGFSIVDYDVGGDTIINVSLTEKREAISKLKIFDPLLEDAKEKKQEKDRITNLLKKLNKETGEPDSEKNE